MNDALEPLATILDPIAPIARTWRFYLDWHPWGTNEERRWHHMRRSQEVALWREAFATLGRAERGTFIPQPDKVRIIATETIKSGVGHDVGGTLPAVKAAVDGLVDAGLVPHDGPRHVLSLTFLVPRKTDRAGLEVVAKECF